MLQIIPENTGFGSNAGVIKSTGSSLQLMQKNLHQQSAPYSNYYSSNNLTNSSAGTGLLLR